MLYPKDKIEPTEDYFALTFTADSQGKVIIGAQTHWVGWADEHKRIELREASISTRPGWQRGQICSWLFRVDSEKSRFRKSEFLFGPAANGERDSDLYLCKTRCQRDIEATDRQIDQLVYELYVIPS